MLLSLVFFLLAPFSLPSTNVHESHCGPLGCHGEGPHKEAYAFPAEALEIMLLDSEHAHLHWENGRSTVARFDQNAIAKLEIPAEAKDYGLRLVEPLMPSIGLYQVACEDEKNGIVCAHKLQEKLPIFPDLSLKRRLAFSPPSTDPRREGQWYLDTIRIDEAWALSVGDESVEVAVVDNGCDMQHEDLLGQFLPGKDVVLNSDDPSHVPGRMHNEHGTACSGLVAAIGNNDKGMVGVCPMCRLRCIRLIDDSALTSLSRDILAFNVQYEWGVAVSSNSWGFSDHVPVPRLWKEALVNLIAYGRGGLGTIVVFAAGNDHREIFPDELYGIDGVVTVGAINAFDEMAAFSNFGSVVDLVAPTGSLTTDISGPDGDNEGDYMTLFGGTSSAAPLVAGVAALMVAMAPEMTASSLVDILIENVRPALFALPDETGHDPSYGYGIVSPLDALLAMSPDAEEDAVSETVEQENDEDTNVLQADDETLPSEGCHSSSLNPDLYLLFSSLILFVFFRKLCYGKACSLPKR